MMLWLDDINLVLPDKYGSTVTIEALRQVRVYLCYRLHTSCMTLYMQACMHACMHAYIPTTMHACMHACMHTYTHRAICKIEPLCQVHETNGCWDSPARTWRKFRDLFFVISCTSTASARHEVSQRFLRRFSHMNLARPDEHTVPHIFEPILKLHFAEFPDPVANLVVPTLRATNELYEFVHRQMPPTLRKIHYHWNLRDVAAVVHGMMLPPCDVVLTPVSMMKLWAHECLRVFYDRLSTDDDRHQFALQLAGLLKFHSASQVVVDADPHFRQEILIWGMHFGPLASEHPEEPTAYQQATSEAELVATLRNKLLEYNAASRQTLQLIFFPDAVRHLYRISHALVKNPGHILMLGIGGLGKRSLTRLACFIHGMECQEPALKTGYSRAEFREQLKHCLWLAGVENTPVTLMVGEQHLQHDFVMEDLSALISSGEIFSIYKFEDEERITKYPHGHHS